MENWTEKSTCEDNVCFHHRGLLSCSVKKRRDEDEKQTLSGEPPPDRSAGLDYDSDE